jgi:hypothetical protein
MQGKIKKKGLFPVRVYLQEAGLAAMITLAEKLGFRKVGIPIKTQKPHGFADEWRVNADGVGRAFKFLKDYYDKTEASRLADAARIAADRAALDREAQEKGISHLFAGQKSPMQKIEKPPEGGGVG